MSELTEQLRLNHELTLDNEYLRKRVEVAEDEYLQQTLVTESLGEKYEVMKAERDRCRDALRPFAHPALSRLLGGNVQGDESPVYGREDALLKIGDFKRAAEALKEVSHD